MNIKEYISSQLNDEQTLAALHTNTPSLIIAGAGSGKTRVLTYKIAYLRWWLKTPIQRVLAVTFTNKATNEMKERLIKISEEIGGAVDEKIPSAEAVSPLGKGGQKIPPTPLTEGGQPHDDIMDFLVAIEADKQDSNSNQFRLFPYQMKWIGTFHSIFLKILKEDIDKLWMKYTKDFTILDSNDTASVVKEILKRLNLQDVFKPNEVKWLISKLKNDGMTPSDFLKWVNSNYDETMWKVYEEYQKTLETSNSLDFDDLLLLPYQLFRKDPQILQKWQNAFDYILVDEAQDTNWIQFELMKMMSWWWAKMTLIGDDFQSIYGWRWALMENFLNVKMYWPDIQMFKLQINYRSKPHIVAAWNAIIKNNARQYEKNIVANRSGTEKDLITIFSHSSDVDEAANTIELIKKMKNSWKFKEWWQVAILYRTNSQSSVFESLFIQEWIPYKIWWAFKFFERKEIKDVLAYLRFFLNEKDNLALKRIINIPNRKIWATTWEKIENYALEKDEAIYDTIRKLRKAEIMPDELKLTPQAMTGIKSFIESMTELEENLVVENPSDFIESLVKKINYRDYLVKEEWWEQQADEKYENVGQLINMANKYIEKWEETLRQFMEEVSLLSDITENEKWDIDAVKLMTVHSSKWLEFPCVFIVGLEDGIFPLSNATLDPKLLEEERRLMYVAVTRAKDVLFLSYAHSRMTWGQVKNNPPSRFLAELPQNLVKSYDLSWWLWGEPVSNISEGDMVRHKLFGIGYVMEVWNNMAIVKFQNPKFWLRKVELRFLELS